MVRLILVPLIVWAVVFPLCMATHFRGAMITYRKEDSTDGKIHLPIDYRIAWRRSYDGHYCDSSTISRGTFNSQGTLECLSNCQGNLGNMAYQCTDFSTVEDWTSGRGHIDAILPNSLSTLYDFGFKGCCWISTLEVGQDGNWELRVRANLTTRSDTGRVNSPPGTDITPIVRLQSGCNNTIRIPVYDAEGDTVRCRWAIGNECGSVCSAFTNAILDEETCTITYQSQNYYENGTWYAVALQIEDFVNYTPQSQPLSSIPLQFLVNVLHSDAGCQVGSRPVFGETTLPDRSCITVPYGSHYTTNITVIAQDNTSIAEIQTISPLGLTKGPLIHQSRWNSSVWSMEVTWSPRDNSTTNHLFCYTAITSLGIKSEKRCIDLFVEGEGAPRLSGRYLPGRQDSHQTSFSVAFDKQFTWPKDSANISVFFWNGTLIEQIDATDTNSVRHNGNILEFNISAPLQPGYGYSFRFDKGVVRGITNCKQPSSYQTLYTDIQTAVRLVNGTRPSEGLVEVYTDNQWQTVCTHRFNETDAAVICRMLGYVNSNSTVVRFYNSTQPYNTGGITGYGCGEFQHDLIGCNKLNYVSNQACYNGLVVSIDCGFPIRLVDGPTPSSGRVEVDIFGQRYTLCGRYFDEHEADVICRTLGYSTGRVSNNTIAGPNYMSFAELNCTGSEVDAYQCMFYTNYWHIHYHLCWGNHTLDAGVECGTDVRLVNGHSPSSGRVEVNYKGEWGTVCDDSFDVLDARVICKMLGYYIGDSYIQVHTAGYYGSGYGNIVIDDLDCTGNETGVSNCNSSIWLTHDCGHSEDVGIDCQYGSLYTTTTAYTTAPSTAIRLVNGRDRYSGRVEVWYNGRWGTVCDDGFDHDDVKVICRMLGMNFGDSYGVAYSNAHFGAGNGPIVIDDLACRGYENVIQSCNSNTWGSHDCSHSEDAGVDCRALTNSPSYTTSYMYNATAYVTNRYTTTRYPYWITTNHHYRLEDAVSVSCNENGWYVRVNMNILHYLYPDAVAGDIYMGENTCTGIDRGYEVVFQQGLQQCLTNEMAIGDSLVYRNQLVYAEHDRNHPFIIRNYNWTVELECDVNRNETSSGHIHHDLSPNNSHHVSGSSEFAVNMSFFSDPNFQHQLQGNPLHAQVGQNIYAKVFSTVADWTIKMRVHTCFMKPTPTAGGHLDFYIIRDGCEVDTNTHLISQSTHETRFVFQNFQYTSNSEGIYVYCHATFCDTSDYSRSCTQACNPTVRGASIIAMDGPVDGDEMTNTTDQP